jgi:DNA-binding transcriptional LysR family regulator
MRLDWLEDILAVIETGSFVEAAKRRFLSQPAFSRRIRMIEQYVGSELFDRTKKPVQLKSAVYGQQSEIRELVVKLHELRNNLGNQHQDRDNQIIIASQHAITTSVAPTLIKNLATINGLTTLLRSANRDECYALLIKKQVELILIYYSESDELPEQQDFFQKHELARERLIPVCLKSERALIAQQQQRKGWIPVVSYPSDSFLGQVLEREIFFRLRSELSIHRVAETSLTLAILPMTLAGVGVGWLPDTLVAPELKSGALVDLSEEFPCCELRVMAIGLKSTESARSLSAWETVVASAQS